METPSKSFKVLSVEVVVKNLLFSLVESVRMLKNQVFGCPSFDFVPLLVTCDHIHDYVSVVTDFFTTALDRVANRDCRKKATVYKHRFL